MASVHLPAAADGLPCWRSLNQHEAPKGKLDQQKCIMEPLAYFLTGHVSRGETQSLNIPKQGLARVEQASLQLCRWHPMVNISSRHHDFALFLHVIHKHKTGSQLRLELKDRKDFLEESDNIVYAIVATWFLYIYQHKGYLGFTV